MDIVLRHAASDAEVAACFDTMCELRPHLSSAGELVERVARQRADGYRLLAAWQGDAGQQTGAGQQTRAVVALAGYRVLENLIHGRFVYVDDLVTTEPARRAGLGRRLLDAVATEAHTLGCGKVVLDTALANALAHRFYYRQGMLATALRFALAVT
jgi:GNAT superfamily N-acetyltransferase